jgi:multidrug efflux system membrane fusion protein
LRSVDAGNVMRASDAGGLVVVTQVQPISATFNMPQSELPQVLAAAAQGPLHVAAFARDGDVALDHGTLELIDNQIDPASGTVRVKVTFPNAERKLWPGQFVNLQLRIGTVRKGVAVPARVIQRGDNGPFAFVIRADDTVELRPVRVRAENDGQIVVDQGLSAGERVVVDGQLRLRPGSKVKAGS